MKRRDLALQYFPDKEPKEAVRSLHRWIINCPDLVHALAAADRQFQRRRELTVRQVRTILFYLGDP